MMGSRARVLVVYTGGTFGMVYKESGNSASPLVPAKLGDLRSAIQEAEPNLGAHYEARCDFILPTEKFVPVDSANIGPAQWKALAHCIKRNYKDYDGFVILHGTDTLAYSAAALSFMLQNLGKPIVFTGSQIPFVIDRSDGRLNLSNSVAIAGGYVKRPGEILRIPRVMVCFGSELLLGTRARKLSAGSLAGFASPNCAPLAHLGEKIEFSAEAEAASRESYGHRLTVQDKFSQSVVDVVLYPGIRADLLRRMLFAKGVEGAILRTFGAGNAPTRDEIVSVFRDAQRRKKVILNVTQCSEGEVDMLLYDVGTVAPPVSWTVG